MLVSTAISTNEHTFTLLIIFLVVLIVINSLFLTSKGNVNMYLATLLVNFFLDAFQLASVINANHLKEFCVDAIIHYAGCAAR